MSLPEPWVERIFDKLTLVYGQTFLRRWADIDLEKVKGDWAHELSGFAQHPRAISWALQNLPPEKPPTVLEFRALARKAPAEEVVKLEAPKADPMRVNAELARLAPVREAPRVDHRAWARTLLARSEAGEKVRSISLRFAREALGVKV